MSALDAIGFDDFAASPDRMPALVIRYRTDRGSLERLLSAPYSAWRRTRLDTFLTDWQNALESLPFEALTHEDQADWLLLHQHLATEKRNLAQEASQYAEAEPLVPFASALIALEEARRRLEPLDPAQTAAKVDKANRQVTQVKTALAREEIPCNLTLFRRAARITSQVRAMLEQWYSFSQGYDPLFTWWVAQPYQVLIQSLQSYADDLNGKLGDDETIVGDPIGREALQAELEDAQISNTPEELMAQAKQEQEWCLAEMRKAAQALGHGDDWHAALEQVKSEHVPPGEQPALVRDLASEALDYILAHDLVTVPPLAAETWRMEMMPPERQKTSPFFLGGETIIVSFPTHEMDHTQKLMSLRGNNRAFSRATVQHELIPGHHLQGFSQARYRPYRTLFYTPFWTEGWTLHWEMLLWEMGFPKTPQEKIGMLFWRLHRCVRVLFSLRFHLGQMTAAECVEMLVEDVGHERANALAEVRRSFEGSYGALYQAAYLIGGLQVHALYQELVDSGQMTTRAFHNGFLRENCMPIATVRALMTQQPFARDSQPHWHFPSS